MRIFLLWLSSAVLLGGCTKPPESVNMLVDKVKGNFQEKQPAMVADKGLPFFSPRALKMVWHDGQPIVRVPRLTLLDQEGRKRDLGFFLGQVSVLGFFAAGEKGQRPVVLKNLKYIESRLPTSSRVQYIAITVNPVHDMPRQLRDYARSMKIDTKSSWSLMTGPVETIYGLAKNTFASPVAVQSGSDGVETFGHSDKVYIIDQEGRLRGIARGTQSEIAAETRRVVKLLLAPPKVAPTPVKK